jgi:7-carboxy-7-deazaguanine synthase
VNNIAVKPILISEIFGPTIQGEGALVGKPTVFVRTGGCDYRCSWCDTLYAVLPEHRGEWHKMDAEEILQRVQELSGGPILVTLSGGNPALQPLELLLDLGHERGFTFALETQGSIAREWFAKLDYLVLSPKPPSCMETDWRVASCIAPCASTHTV